jgi:mannose-6-phosphate isomerase-like protein (cupin superfamily)
MRLNALVLAILGVMTLSSEARALTTYSTSPFRTEIAEATVPDRDDARLYFSVYSGFVSTNEQRELAFGDGIFYQSTGRARLTIDKQNVELGPGEGIFMPAGTRFTLGAVGSGAPSTYLQFLLLSYPELRSGPPAGAVEVYRSASPIPGLQRERNLLTLNRVRVPSQAPLDPLHQRSGAALHYILSGVGAEFTETRATERTPGSISYQPRGLAYHWSNPGRKPLIYLVFNVSPKDLPPVLRVDGQASDPVAANAHVTWAIYCIVLSMIVTLILWITIKLDRDQGIKTPNGQSKS